MPFGVPAARLIEAHEPMLFEVPAARLIEAHALMPFGVTAARLIEAYEPMPFEVHALRLIEAYAPTPFEAHAPSRESKKKTPTLGSLHFANSRLPGKSCFLVLPDVLGQRFANLWVGEASAQ